MEWTAEKHIPEWSSFLWILKSRVFGGSNTLHVVLLKKVKSSSQRVSLECHVSSPKRKPRNQSTRHFVFYIKHTSFAPQAKTKNPLSPPEKNFWVSSVYYVAFSVCWYKPLLRVGILLVPPLIHNLSCYIRKHKNYTSVESLMGKWEVRSWSTRWRNSWSPLNNLVTRLPTFLATNHFKGSKSIKAVGNVLFKRPIGQQGLIVVNPRHANFYRVNYVPLK